jgi:hypothetical protein
LKGDEIDKAYFQQDGATAHTAQMSMALLDDVFVERIFLKPFGLQDLRIFLCPIFFLWDAMKNSAYSNSPHTVDELKMAITDYIRNVDHAKLNTVFENTVQHSINVWKLAGDTLNITCNFLYCNHQVHRDFLITLYFLMYIIMLLFCLNLSLSQVVSFLQVPHQNPV